MENGTQETTAAASPARKAVALLVAAMSAPPLLLFLFLPWGGLGVIFVLPFAFALSIGFGLPGSAAQLALAFGLLDLISKRRQQRRSWFVLAGVAAGATHVGLAYLSTHDGWPKELGFLLGTWFTASALDKAPLQISLSALLAGAAAGAMYAGIRLPSRITPAA